MAVQLRHWRESDAAEFSEAVRDSLEELRPWMPWVAGEPKTDAQRAEMVREWERERESGGDEPFGIFVDGVAAESCGLHRRVGEGGLEIGYWVRTSLTGRGVATEASRLLCAVAFADPAIDHVEIHHDRANKASGRVPAKLGFELVAENRNAPEAPGEEGVERVWRLTRAAWERSRAT